MRKVCYCVNYTRYIIMFKILLILLLVVLVIVLLIPILLFSIVWRILALFGIVKKPRTSFFYQTWQSGWNTSQNNSGVKGDYVHSHVDADEKKKKMFNKEDGEYVDFEEIKD